MMYFMLDCCCNFCFVPQNFDHGRPTREHALFVTSGIPFYQTCRSPKPELQIYFQRFAQLIQQISFAAPIKTKSQSASANTSRCPFVHDGGMRDFDRLYLNYSHVWCTNKQKKNPSADDIIRTEVFKSNEAVPVLVLRVFSNNSILLGIAQILTPDIVDFSNPFNRIHCEIRPAFRYEVIENSVLENSKNPRGRSFDTLWKARQYLLSREMNVDYQQFELIADVSEGRNGSIEPLCSGFGCRVRNISGYSGSVSLFTYFNVKKENLAFLRGGVSLADFLTAKLPEGFNSTDKFGAPILRLPYNPNLPVFHRAARGQYPSFETFEASDAEDFIKKEALDDVLHRGAVRRWRSFFSTRNLIVNGPEQWKAIEEAYATSEKATFINKNWQNAVNQQHCQDYPRFLIEIWCLGEFCGELLLPRMVDLNDTFRSKRIHKLHYESSNSLTRKDHLKATTGFRVTGWIYLIATWRCLNSKTGRLNLCIRELRDISTPSCSLTELVHGAPQVFVFMKKPTTTKWVEVQKFTPFQMASYFLHPNQAYESMESAWHWDSEVMVR